MKNNLVSIIMPCYNSEKYIAQAIRSVQIQTYPHWELIVIDDCSADKSVEIIESIAKEEKRLKLIKLDKNSGTAVARNIGIKEATGRYIAFLDSDDLWLPQKLEKQIEFMKIENTPLTYSSYFIIDKYGNTIGLRKAPQVLTYKKNLKSNFIGNLTGIYDTFYFGKVYMENVKHEDYAFYLKLLRRVKYIKGIEIPLAKYRVSVGLSKNKFKSAIWYWTIIRKCENLNLIKSLYFFSWYIYYGIKNYKFIFSPNKNDDLENW